MLGPFRDRLSVGSTKWLWSYGLELGGEDYTDGTDGEHKEGGRTWSHGHGDHHLAPAWSGKNMGLRTDFCLGAGAEKFGGQWVCGNSIRKQGVSKRCIWYDSGPPQ